MLGGQVLGGGRMLGGQVMRRTDVGRTGVGGKVTALSGVSVFITLFANRPGAFQSS